MKRWSKRAARRRGEAAVAELVGVVDSGCPGAQLRAERGWGGLAGDGEDEERALVAVQRPERTLGGEVRPMGSGEPLTAQRGGNPGEEGLAAVLTAQRSS